MLILILVVNTSFVDFLRLLYFLVCDGFISRQFGIWGDRLVFSNGIFIFGGTVAGFVIVFGGETHALIPLYAFGVFIHTGEPGEQKIADEVGHALEQLHQLGDGDRRQSREPIEQRRVGGHEESQ